MVISVICFPLSYKLSTGVSSVLVLKRTFGVFRIRQGQLLDQICKQSYDLATKEYYLFIGNDAKNLLTDFCI